METYSYAEIVGNIVLYVVAPIVVFFAIFDAIDDLKND
jgi:hypothetical protein